MLSRDTLGACSYIYIRYQADSHKIFGNIIIASYYWYNNLIYMEMSYVVDSGDINDPNNEFTWHYQDPFN